MSGERMRLLLADDEPLALRRLELALQSVPNVEIVSSATDGMQAVTAMRALRPDVVLLDVRMPLMDGFEVVNAANDAGAPIIIFVTAYDSYAVRAFAAAAVDYLVKPVEFERLASAIERARSLLASKEAERRVQELAAVVDALRREAEGRGGYESEFWIKDRGRFVRVPVAEADLIEAERDYVRIHWEGRTLLHRETMARLEKMLDPEVMLRVHRSSFVNRRRLAAIRRDIAGRTLVILSDGREVSVSRAYVQKVMREVRFRRGKEGDC
jgi:DNA-binding LytR/AlgR family response regulator